MLSDKSQDEIEQTKRVIRFIFMRLPRLIVFSTFPPKFLSLFLFCLLLFSLFGLVYCENGLRICTPFEHGNEFCSNFFVSYIIIITITIGAFPFFMCPDNKDNKITNALLTPHLYPFLYVSVYTFSI